MSDVETGAAPSSVALTPVTFLARCYPRASGGNSGGLRFPVDGHTSDAFPGLVVHPHPGVIDGKPVGSWLISHLESGRVVWPPGHPTQDVAVDYATRFAMLVDWRQSMEKLQRNKPLQDVIQSLFL